MKKLRKHIFKFESQYLISAMILTTISWIHYIETGSIVVDFNPTKPFWFNISLAIITGITIVHLACISYQRIEQKIDMSATDVRKLFYAVALIAAFMLPLFTNDFFSYLGYADMSMKGCNVYSQSDCSVYSVFARYINPMYIQVACKYGPLNLLIVKAGILWVGNSVLMNYFYYKMILLLFGIGYIELGLLLRKQCKSAIDLNILLITPIWWIQGIGQGHNDIFGVVFIVLSIYLLSRYNIAWSIIAIVIAIYFKYTYIYILILPLLYQMYLSKQWINIKILVWSVCTIIAIIGLGYIFYIPYVHHYSEILDSFRSMSTGGPSSTFSDIISFIALVFHDNFIENYERIIPLCQTIGLLLLVLIGVRFIYKKEYNSRASIYYFLLQIFAIMMFVYSHRFLPWYIIILPVFIMMISSNAWFQYMMILFVFSMFQDISVMIGTDHILGQIVMVASTLVVVGVNLYAISSRFGGQNTTNYETPR